MHRTSGHVGMELAEATVLSDSDRAFFQKASLDRGFEIIQQWSPSGIGFQCNHPVCSVTRMHLK